ncbi:MAG TPA: 50S ribosomal protein L11 methyltransferase [Steroidobacteraceae bacterium]|nr:50S ribosomal protein L11 methyltransferase [Steroidobacteraceae bacterium]
MPFLQFTADVGAADPGLLEEACFLAGALSVTLTDAADNPVLEPAPGATPLWPTIRLSALFPEQDPQRVAALLTTFLDEPLPLHRFEEVRDRPWEREWLKDFRPLRFGKRLWVCPHGAPAPDEDAVVVWLDPGLAFGTGSHPSTRLCLEWLDAAQLNGSEAIDYGCGSGILSIAALRLGARSVVAVDIDPQALIATHDNAARNDVAERVLTCPPEASVAAADILLANILSEPLLELAPRFATLVRPGGRLVLAGLIVSQAGPVTLAYRPWFDIRPSGAHDDWVCLEGVRR